jgi:hypothetical protein
MYTNAENQQIYTREEINNMKERNIVINAQGTERGVPNLSQFPDKKIRTLDYTKAEEVVTLVSEFKKEIEVGQKEATWIPKLDIPGKPLTFLFLTDVHYLSTHSETKVLNEMLDIVKDTPNFYVITGGDDCDNFNTSMGKLTSGMMENPLEGGIQGQMWRNKMRVLDDLGKIGGMVFCNHTDWMWSTSGVDFYDTFLGQFQCPLFTSGGELHIKLGQEQYDIGLTHKYWGTSKLNPTNACKRFLDFEHPNADIILLGHTHQSEVLTFEKGGREVVGAIGGTLKLYDTWARKNGIGGRAGSPGICFTLWPDHHEMVAYKHIDRAASDHLKRL